VVPLLTVLGLFIAIVVARRKLRRKPRIDPDYMATPLIVAAGLNFDIRRLCSGVLCLGETGSGKTTGVMAWMVETLMLQRGGGLIGCPKPDDAKRWLKFAKRCGREKDVILIDPSGSHRLNFFATLLRCRGDPATKALLAGIGWSVFSEAASRGDPGRAGDDSAFWKNGQDRLIRSIILLLLLADATVTPTEILRVMYSVPSQAAIAVADWGESEWWKNSYLWQLLERAHRSATANGWMSDYRAVRDYFVMELPNLSHKTRSVFEAMVTGVADSLTKGLAAKILATDSTFDLAEAISAGKWVLIDLPIG
jgi:hypothetical protein